METAVIRLSDNKVETHLPGGNKTFQLPGTGVAATPHKKKVFIEANTQEVSLSHLKRNCIIPVFTKDNEVTISHQSFIEAAVNALTKFLPGVPFDEPEVRVSHEIKGRTPDALHIPAKELLDYQKTSYFERMAFIIRVPSITENINGNLLSLTIGGVRAYNLDNLYNKKSYEKFKFFIGFQNMVCCNLCISTDGYQQEARTMSIYDLEEKMLQVIQAYNMEFHLNSMQSLTQVFISEQQFAQFIGKGKLYNYLPKAERALLPELLLTDSHISTIAKDYYSDESFCRNSNGNLSIWNMYNLFTGANKGSYIDTFLDRGVNASSFSEGILKALSSDSSYSWFLS